MAETIFEVTKVSWERIFLLLDVQTSYEGEVKFRLEKMCIRDSIFNIPSNNKR